ncbi:hypothetical protein CEXT_340701 [Caerostris extrusa]|uniref:Uncharacterized protein n=1 Tax=Caerostris extrusa TaxID=172846 RepID=A0AAV4TE91_CAEEX|nr:hypothetical protein CEXT_340701 [Caerostris extrusa]
MRGRERGRRDFPRLPSQLIFSSLFRPRLFSCEQDLEKSVNKGNFRLRRVLCKKPIYLAVSIDDASISGPDCSVYDGMVEGVGEYIYVYIFSIGGSRS